MRQQAKYLQIAHILVGRIQHMLPGSRCPGVNQIAQEFHVARATAERVLRYLVQHGYVEQVVGSGTFVAERRSRKIIVLVPPDPAHGVGPQHNPDLRLAGVVSQRLQQAGYQVVVRSEEPSPRELLAQDPDLLVTVGVTSNRYLEEILRHGKPIVTIDSSTFGLPADFVFSAVVRNSYLATRSLFEAGLRRIWLVGTYYGSANASITSLGHGMGFHAASYEAGQAEPGQRIHLLKSPADLDRILADLFASNHRPQAIVTADNRIGEHFLSAARQRGVRVPLDLAIFAAHGEEPAQVTCLVRDHEQIASAITSVAWHRLHEPDRPPQHQVVVSKFIDAGTIPPEAAAFIRRMLPQRERAEGEDG